MTALGKMMSKEGKRSRKGLRDIITMMNHGQQVLQQRQHVADGKIAAAVAPLVLSSDSDDSDVEEVPARRQVAPARARPAAVDDDETELPSSEEGGSPTAEVTPPAPGGAAPARPARPVLNFDLMRSLA